MRLSPVVPNPSAELLGSGSPQGDVTGRALPRVRVLTNRPVFRPRVKQEVLRTSGQPAAATRHTSPVRGPCEATVTDFQTYDLG